MDRAGVDDVPAEPASCTPGDDGCITCGDVGIPLVVVEVAADGDARCADVAGRHEIVATDLVGPVAPGERILVHAGVAIARLATLDHRTTEASS